MGSWVKLAPQQVCYSMLSAIFLLPSLLLVSAQHCGPEELDSVGERVTACVIRHQESLQDAAATFPGEVYLQEAACDTVRRILEDCGSMWAACYTQPEVRQLRELQLAALRETLAASLDPETCALDAPGTVDEWREVEVRMNCFKKMRLCKLRTNVQMR